MPGFWLVRPGANGSLSVKVCRPLLETCTLGRGYASFIEVVKVLESDAFSAQVAD